MNSLKNNAIYGVAFVLGILLLCQSTIAYNQKVEVKRMDIATCLGKYFTIEFFFLDLLHKLTIIQFP